MKKSIKTHIQPKLDIRKERVAEFFKNEMWKSYQRLSEWDIKNDIKYLRRYDAFEYEYVYKYIMYYNYKASCPPPIEPIENHFYCKQCKIEIPNSEGRGKNICETCRKEYRRVNYAERERNSMRKKYHSNPSHRIGCVIKTHINHILNSRFNKIRDVSWEQTVGLSKTEFLDYILQQCEPNWTMDNYGTKWVIQHIIPRDWAVEKEDAYLLNYYKNLMPWGYSDNAALGDRIDVSQFNEWHYSNERIQQIIKNNE
jgi:hypothetical protein